MNLLKFLPVAVVLGAVILHADEILSPIPSVPTTPPAMQDYVTATTGQAAPQTAPGIPQGNTPLQWGPVSLRPRIDYQFLYGDGIPAGLGNRVSSAVHTVSPGITLGLGTHWTVDYAPSWTFYSNRTLTNSFDNSVTLSGGATFESWILGISSTYSESSGPLAETGQQTEQQTFTTALSATYTINERWRVDLGADQTLRFAQQFSDTREWSTMDWLNYNGWSRFEAGVGVGGGFSDLDQQPDQTYEQTQGRFTWKPTKKLRLSVNGGAEFRQTPSTIINPIFGAGLDYRPFESTTLSIHGSRSVDNSYYSGQITETLSAEASLTQRFFKRYFVTLGASYGDTKYKTTTTTVFTPLVADRHDTSYALTARIGTSFWNHGTVSAFYEYSDNTSNYATFDFISHQFGGQIGFRY